MDFRFASPSTDLLQDEPLDLVTDEPPGFGRAGRVLFEGERELAALDTALASASAGSGTLVAFEGHAGLGKSALIKAAGTQGHTAGLRVLRARCGVMEKDVPWGADCRVALSSRARFVLVDL